MRRREEKDDTDKTKDIIAHKKNSEDITHVESSFDESKVGGIQLVRHGIG